MKNDDFGDRMKGYEREFVLTAEDKIITEDNGSFEYPAFDYRPLPYYPYMRIDGRSFSRFTKKLAARGLIIKPRDIVFEGVFVSAVIDLVKEFNLKLAFHQSDEISIFFSPVLNEESQMVFGGKLQKMVSVIPSYFTSRFCQYFYAAYGEVPECSFDGRLCVFPSSAEATNMLVWRYQDASRNLIQDIAHHRFGAKKLHQVSTNEKFTMIGSPELRPGNFIKTAKVATPVLYKPEYGDGNITGTQMVLRSQTTKRDVDFQNMDFPSRESLIYSDFYELPNDPVPLTGLSYSERAW